MIDATEVDEFLASVDVYYPGSKNKRRDLIDSIPKDDQEWRSKYVKKLLNGEEREFYYPGAMALALGKTTVTIRLWERKSYIPKAPYRLPGYTNTSGKQIPGKRVYSREIIEATIDEFQERNLLGTARVEWKEHHDLTIALYERWKNVLDNTTTTATTA